MYKRKWLEKNEKRSGSFDCLQAQLVSTFEKFNLFENCLS